MKKVKVSDIIITEEQKEALKLVTHLARSSRNQERKKIIGFSDCICCGNTPAKLITRDVSDPEDDIKSYHLETYCTTCFKSRFNK
jgi:hypothetical protein